MKQLDRQRFAVFPEVAAPPFDVVFDDPAQLRRIPLGPLKRRRIGQTIGNAGGAHGVRRILREKVASSRIV